MRHALPTRASEGDPSLPIGAMTGLSLLLVDDSADTLSTMAMLLEIEGATIECAASGEEAIARAAEKAFDVIVSDVGMPRINGYQMLEAIRAGSVNRHTPAIALSGYDEGSENSQFDQYLLKPVEISLLIEAIVRTSGSR